MLAQLIQTGGMQIPVSALGYDVGNLPLFPTIQQYPYLTAAESSYRDSDSSGLRGSRNQSTSIGWEVLIGSNPASRRTRENRPSEPTVSRARSSWSPFRFR